MKALKESNEMHDKYASEVAEMHCMQALEEVKRVIDKRLPEMRRIEKELEPSVSHLYLLRTALYSEAKEKNKKYLEKGLNETDPRLDSFLDYLIANNVDKALAEAAITEQLAIADTKEQHKYVQAYVEIKKTSVKTIKSLSSDVSEELRKWHRCYEQFRTANGIFMMGIDYMLQGDYVSGISCLMKCCLMNRSLVAMEPVTIHEAHKKMVRDGFFIDMCIGYCNEDLIKRFESGEDDIAELVKAVLIPAIHFLKSSPYSNRVKAVKGRWKKIDPCYKKKWMDIIKEAFEDVFMFGGQDVVNLSQQRVNCFQSENGPLGLNKFYGGYIRIISEWSSFEILDITWDMSKLKFNKKLEDHEKGPVDEVKEIKDNNKSLDTAKQHDAKKTPAVTLDEDEELAVNSDKSKDIESSPKLSKKDRKRIKKQQQRQQNPKVLQKTENVENMVSIKVYSVGDADEFKEMADGVVEKAEKDLKMKISEIQSLQSEKEILLAELLKKNTEFTDSKIQSEESIAKHLVEVEELVLGIENFEYTKRSYDGKVEEINDEIRKLEKKRSSLISTKGTFDIAIKEFENRRKRFLKLVDDERSKSDKSENVFKTRMHSLETKIKTIDQNIENIKLNKTLTQKEEAPKANSNSKMIQFLESSIRSKEAQLECPVCLCVAKSPIFSCSESHLVCGACRPQLSLCPECRVEYKDQRRHRYAEIMASELETLRKEREELIL